MTSPNDPPVGRPASFDEWLQAFKEQASFFTGLKLNIGAPRWQLADVLPVLPFVGAGVGLAAGLVFAIVRGVAGPGWLAGVLAVGAAVLIKVACLAQFSGATGLVVLIAAHSLSRAVLAWPLLAFSPVHQDGLGAEVGKPTDNDVWRTIGIGAALAFLLLLGKGFFVAVLAPIVSIAVAWFASRWIAERIGGYTGDTLGAVQQKAELAFLVVATLMIAH